MDTQQSLSKLVIFPRRRSNTHAKLENGVQVAFTWSFPTDPKPFRLTITFRGGRVACFYPEVSSTGAAMWLRSKTHRLAPAFVEKLATAIDANPEGKARVAS